AVFRRDPAQNRRQLRTSPSLPSMTRRAGAQPRQEGGPGIVTRMPDEVWQPPPGSWASTRTSRETMVANRSRDTGPELAVRSAVHRLGLRYRVGARPLPQLRRTADLVFVRERVAVYIDGCWWHGCPWHWTAAKRNADYWSAKIAANQDRDADTDRRLAEAGWVSFRVWEHEEPREAAERIAAAVRDRRAAPAG
ncbi:MAG: very short patch repair endonuclease, partial [Egibacteraceae bacterium]